jgi:hypothetical protein
VVFFTLKILRFLFRIVLKTLLLPFRLVFRLVRRGSSDDGDYYDQVDEHPDSGAEASTGTGERTTTGDESATADSVSRPPETETTTETPVSNTSAYSLVDTKREEFRNAIAVLGGLAVVGALMLNNEVPQYITAEYSARFQSAIVVPILVTAVVWVGLNRRSKLAWAAGVLWPALAFGLYFERTLAPWYLNTHGWGLWYLLDQTMEIQDFLIGAIGVIYVAQGLRARPSTWFAPDTTAASGGETSVDRTNRSSRSTRPSPNQPTPDDAPRPTGSGGDAVTAEDSNDTATGGRGDGVEPAAPGASAGVDAAQPDRTSSAGQAAGSEQTRSATSRQTKTAAGRGASDGAERAPEDTGDARDGTDRADENAPAESQTEKHETAITADDPSTRERGVRRIAEAVEAGDLDPSAAVDVLRKAVSDDDPAVRVAVCEALGVAGTEAARDELDRLRIDPDSDVSRAATRANRHFD